MIRLTILLAAVFISVLACNEVEMPEKKLWTVLQIKDLPEKSLAKLSEKKIFFGHMSVGFNIMSGVEEILKENAKLKLDIVETNDTAEFRNALFAHSRIGKNHEPLSKIKGFVTLMKNGLGKTVDIAFLKFCFVDINSSTHIENLFEEYKKSMADVRKGFPEVVFVHMTTPLTVVQKGWKAIIKRIIGLPIDGYEDNIKRDAFNNMLRKEYGGREPIFDLAMFESILPDRTRSTFTKGGKEYPYLAPEYTKDGGHLNEKGRKFVAEQLLILLAKLADHQEGGKGVMHDSRVRNKTGSSAFSR